MNIDDERLAFWRRHWAAWQSSGLSQRAYCQQPGLSFSAFGYWRSRVKDSATSPAPAFVPVRVETAAREASGVTETPIPIHADTGSSVEIRLAHGRTIRVQPGFDEALLARVIRVIQQVSC
ncbi:IS66 family insertion sequence element accessory protein TnpA [Methylocaldum sp. SAD2]|jgi:hypothetical protein|uniref:IS66 family insertion sequence element accessory protein TnpA n=1 Tax=Methylocaldum sp. GT1BB TaxID=3438963 RepID=UPI000A322FD2